MIAWLRRREALVRGRDARTGGVVHVEVGEQVKAGLEPRPVEGAADDERLGPVRHEEVEGIVASGRLRRGPRRGLGSRRAGEEVETEKTARAAGRVGRCGRSTIEDSGHEPRLRHAEPRPAGGEIAAPDRARGLLAEEQRRGRRAREELVAVRGHDERPGREDPYEDGEGAHARRS